MRLHFCGVRGSSPAPGAGFNDVGGHTSCIAVLHDAEPPSLILDAGTGIRGVTALLKSKPFRGTIVLTHLHWDHVMGLPFFAAGDHPEADVTVLIPGQSGANGEVLDQMLGPPLFPITREQLRGRWSFKPYDEGDFELEGFSIRAREVPHKGGRTMGLRVSESDSAFAYIPDHAPHTVGPGASGMGECHDAAVDLSNHVDLLIHDSQYTPSELPERFDWGHSTADYGLELANHCSVGRLIMFHHDPSRTDQQVFAIRESLRSHGTIAVDVATEGLCLQI